MGAQTWLSPLVRRDAVYEAYERQLEPSDWGARALYLALYLLPGVVAYVLINAPPVYNAVLALTGLEGKIYQFAIIIAITYGWHMALPVAVLRWNDKLTVRETFAFLGMNRVHWPSLLIFMPLTFAVFVAASIPYMHYLGGPLTEYLYAQSWSTIPPWSIFQAGPDNLYSFSPALLALLFVGNFIGEELYYRAYLMKKTAWLAGWNWFVNSALFTIYHFWQIPQTWPLIGIALVFGAYMQLRKDFYSVVILHLLINLVWPPIMFSVMPLVFR